eukprot:1279115-Heterocapsa_arctica.AAC.1
MKDGPPGQTTTVQPSQRSRLPPQRSTSRFGVPSLLTSRSSRPDHPPRHSLPLAASRPAGPPSRASHLRRT